MEASVTNIEIKSIIEILTRQAEKSKYCNIVINEEFNEVAFVPIIPKPAPKTDFPYLTLGEIEELLD